MSDYVIAFLGLSVRELMHELVFGLISIGLVYCLEIQSHLLCGFTVHKIMFLSPAHPVMDYLFSIVIVIQPIIHADRVSACIRASNLTVHISSQFTDTEGEIDVVVPGLPVFVVKRVDGFVFTGPILCTDSLDRKRIDVLPLWQLGWCCCQ